MLPLALVVGYLVLWTLGQAVAAAYPPRPDLGDRLPGDLGLDARDVTFAARDGVVLAGWYVASRNGAAVVLMHGAGSTRTGVLAHAEVLAEHGFGVLLHDARGHGESDGRGMDLGWWGEDDAVGAVDFVLAQPDVTTDRVGLVGLSLGGEVAIGAAGGDERVAAVVAEGATARVSADKDYLDAYGWRGAVQQQVDAVTTALTDLLTPASQPEPLVESLARAASRERAVSFLLVTAGEVPDELLAAEHLRDAAPDAVEVWTVDGAGHTGGLATARPEWQRRVTDLLSHALVE